MLSVPRDIFGISSCTALQGIDIYDTCINWHALLSGERFALPRDQTSVNLNEDRCPKVYHR